MTAEAIYTIGRLAELAGVTPRTIRYYTAEGLLPRPDARGQYALYGEEHLLRLRLIGRLKEAYLPLSEIKAQLDHLDASQLRQLLDECADLSEAEQPASAAGYIAQVLNRQSQPQMIAESTARYQAAPESGAFAGAQAPMAMLASGADTPPEPQTPAAKPSSFAAPPPEEPARTPAAAPQEGGLLRRLMPSRLDRSPQPPRGGAQSAGEEQWRRVSLAPGIELHVREPVAPTLRERIEQLLGFAGDLFGRD